MHWLLNHRKHVFEKNLLAWLCLAPHWGPGSNSPNEWTCAGCSSEKWTFKQISSGRCFALNIFWQAAECCQEKTVGGVSYSLLPEAFHGSLPHQCLTSCVYTKTGILSSPKFCFARGFDNSVYICVVCSSSYVWSYLWVTFLYPQMFFCIPKRFLKPFWFFVSQVISQQSAEILLPLLRDQVPLI